MKKSQESNSKVKKLKFCYMQQPDGGFYPVAEKTL